MRISCFSVSSSAARRCFKPVSHSGGPPFSIAFSSFVDWSKGHAYHVYGTSAHAAIDYREIAAYQWPRILLLGSEREGLTEEQTRLCDTVIRLPMRGRATSLNLGVASGVMLYAMLDR